MFIIFKFLQILIFFPEELRWISSAYKTVLKLMASTTSLIYIKNSKGQMTDPCAIPHITRKKEDLISNILV